MMGYLSDMLKRAQYVDPVNTPQPMTPAQKISLQQAQAAAKAPPPPKIQTPMKPKIPNWAGLQD